MKIPENLHYSAQHVWLRATDEDAWLVGITDYAQDLLGDIVFVQAPVVGTKLQAGTPCGLVESVKTGSDLHAPLDGMVVAVNTALEKSPELINEKPYDTWIFKLTPTHEEDLTQLLSAAAYLELLN